MCDDFSRNGDKTFERHSRFTAKKGGKNIHYLGNKKYCCKAEMKLALNSQSVNNVGK